MTQKTFVPPVAAAKAAAEGLALRRQFKRGGTPVGIARARDLKNRRSLSAKTIQRMVSFFARHAVDKRGKDFYNKKRPSNGYIAWQLWGGDPGREWSNREYLKIKKTKKKTSRG